MEKVNGGESGGIESHPILREAEVI